MSRIELVLPRLGESVEEGTITVWHVDEGQSVRAGEVLLEVSTDKVESEIEAPADCTIEGISAPAGTTVSVGERLAWLVTASTADPRSGQVDTAEASPPPTAREPEPQAVPEPATEQPAPHDAAAPLGRAAPLSPVVRRLLAEAGLHPAELVGSGRNGRITKRDVVEAAGRRATGLAAPPPRPPAGTSQSAPSVAGTTSTAVVEMLEASADLSTIEVTPDARTASLTFALLRALESHPDAVVSHAPIVVDGRRLDDPFGLRARALPDVLAAAPPAVGDATVSLWDLGDQPITRAVFVPTATDALLSFTVSGPTVELRSTGSGGRGTIEFRPISTIVASYRADRIERRSVIEVLARFVRGIESIDWHVEFSGS